MSRYYGMKNSAFKFLSLRRALKPYGVELNKQNINLPEESKWYDVTLTVRQLA